MSLITITARESDNPFEVDNTRPLAYNGSFETTTAQHQQGSNYLITDAEAEWWFTDNGYTAEDRDTFVRSGHPDAR